MPEGCLSYGFIKDYFLLGFYSAFKERPEDSYGRKEPSTTPTPRSLNDPQEHRTSKGSALDLMLCGAPKGLGFGVWGFRV